MRWVSGMLVCAFGCDFRASLFRFIPGIIINCVNFGHIFPPGRRRLSRRMRFNILSSVAIMVCLYLCVCVSLSTLADDFFYSIQSSNSLCDVVVIVNALFQYGIAFTGRIKLCFVCLCLCLHTFCVCSTQFYIHIYLFQ